MEGSINMINDINEQSLYSDSNPVLLNTPPPHVIDNDAECRTEYNSNDPLQLTDDFSDYLTNFSIPLKEDRSSQTTETIVDLQELAQSIIEIKTDISKQKQDNEKIFAMLTQLIQLNTLSNRNNQQFVLSKTNVSDFGSSIDERPTSDSNQENLMNKHRNSTENNRERHTTFSPSKSNFLSVEDNRNQIGLTTMNKLNFNGQSLSGLDEIDIIRSEKNRGKIQIGQWCNEINVGTTDDAPALITATNRASSTILKNPSVLSDNQSQHTKRREENETTSISNLISCQPSCQLTTTNENLLSNHTGESTKLCLLHPLKEQISLKVDRSTELKDCFGKAPVLIVCGGSLPDNAYIEMAMTFGSSTDRYYRIYQLSEEESEVVDIIFRPNILCGNKSQRIKLNELKVHKRHNNGLKVCEKCNNVLKVCKRCNNDLKVCERCNNGLKVCERCNNKMKENKTYILKHYPTGVSKDTKIDSHIELNNQYNFKQTQLTIRCFKNDKLPLNETIFYSNLLSGESESNKPSRKYDLKISIIRPSIKIISFDNNNSCQMEFSIKIPEPFHCTLLSGYKWLEISIITDDNLSTVYSIDTGDGDNKNPNYFNIKKHSFKMSFKIIKKISSITDLNRFHVRIKLLHSEGFPTQSSVEYYTNCSTSDSEQFTEDKSNLLPQEQETVRDMGKKRPLEDICDYSAGLPVYKAPKTVENVQ